MLEPDALIAALAASGVRGRDLRLAADAAALAIVPAYSSPACECSASSGTGQALATANCAVSRTPEAHEGRISGADRTRTVMARALYAHLAWMLCPADVGPKGCALEPACRRKGCHTRWLGVTAYDAWAADLRSAVRLSPPRRAAARSRAIRWVSARQCAADALERFAGRRREAWARALRSGAALTREEVGRHLSPLIELPRSRPLPTAVRHLGRASQYAKEASGMIGAAAAHLAMVSPDIAEALTISLPEREAASPPAGRVQQGLIYFARAGMPPLRVLSARALAVCEGPGVEAALRELSREADPLLASTAEWAATRSVRR